MLRPTLTALAGGACLALSFPTPAARPVAAQSARSVNATQAITDFTAAQPGTRLSWENGRVARVYGKAFSTGPTAFHSAGAFVESHAEMFGVPAEDLAATGPFADGRHMQPIMFQEDTGAYKFTGCYYTQVRDGIPVFRSRLNLLCRNDAANQVVLAAADLRDLGEYTPDLVAADADLGRLTDVARVEFGGDAVVTRASAVVFAGVNGEDHAPTLAFESSVSIGSDRWLLVIDAETDEILYREHRIFFATVNGNISGMATEGIASDECEAERPMTLPYVQVTSGPNSVFADADGNFSIETGVPGTTSVTADLVGPWFEMFDFSGHYVPETMFVTPPGPADFMFNEENTDRDVLGTVNAYLGANVVRDYVLQFNPSYPTLDQGGMPLNVNREDMYCPGNAWYSADDVSLNFCASYGDMPNFAWSAIIYHEYGHHLIEVAGSGQGQYGEGMSDVMSMLIQDDSRFVVGYNSCEDGVRSAINEFQYPCFSAFPHDCGQLISGCVWDTRMALVINGFDDYREILASLAINSILFHTGEEITPQITLDFLTLDDDNGDIMDGTPHYTQIQAGFGAHNMHGPILATVLFDAPEGIPASVDPSGTDTFPLVLTPFTQDAVPGSAVVHVSPTGLPGTYEPVAMTETTLNVYDVQLPPAACGDPASFYFTVDLQYGGQALFGSQDDPFSTVYASDLIQVFADDFEADLGWTVADDDALSDGTWDRGVPAGNGTRGDPTVDADGTGQCYLTDNVAGNSDVDGGTTILTSPVMDATEGTPFISYWRWYSNSAGVGSTDDTFVVEVNDGTGWVPLETVGPDGPGVAGGWFFKQFRIDDFVELTDQFQIRFLASDLDGGTIIEAAVDGIALDAFSCAAAPCVADVNGDMDVDVNDIVAVITAWGATGGNAADVNGDLVVNCDDLVEVVTNWGACP